MKIQNETFALASSANRVALVTGMIAGLVSQQEAEQAIIADTAPRRWKKPVVAEGVRYDSVSDAARALVAARRIRYAREAYHKVMQSEVKRIARLCTQDCWEGYFWSL